MSDVASNSDRASGQEALSPTLDMKLELILLPVSDADRAKSFYSSLGWNLDMDFVRGETFRVVQFTPRGSSTSIIFGTGIGSSRPGSVQGLYLVVSNIVATRADLLSRGVAVSGLFHDSGGVFHRADAEGRVSGPAPGRRSYGTFATFEDPDGNGWWMQEVTARLPGHALPAGTSFNSSLELAGALRRAQKAHDIEAKGAGRDDDDAWPERYASYIVAEQSGRPEPE